VDGDPQIRNAKGEWACEAGKAIKVCGDGLKAGFVRSTVSEENKKMPSCKVSTAADAEDEFPKCNDQPFTRDETSGKWQDDCAEDQLTPCSDGYNPGVDRSAFTDNVKCKDLEGNDEDLTCGADKVAQVRNAKGEWACP